MIKSSSDSSTCAIVSIGCAYEILGISAMIALICYINDPALLYRSFLFFSLNFLGSHMKIIRCIQKIENKKDETKRIGVWMEGWMHSSFYLS